MADVDIFVGGNPLELKRDHRDVYTDYAERSSSEIFIQDDLGNLLSNHDFIAARDNAFLSRGDTIPEFMDIRVTHSGVFVRENPRDAWIEVEFDPREQTVRAIARKTDAAYSRIIGSSRESSPRSARSPSPLRERHVVYQDPTENERLREQVSELRQENQELRFRLETTSLRDELRGLSSQLKQSGEENAALREQVSVLQGQVDELRKTLQETSGELDSLGQAKQDLEEQVGRLRATIEEQSQQIGSARGETESLAAELEQTKHKLADKTAERDEQGQRVADLEQRLERKEADNGSLTERLKEAQGAARRAEDAAAALQRALDHLDPENAQQKQALQAIEEALGASREGEESNPDAIRRLLSQLGQQGQELRVQGEAFLKAEQEKNDALEGVSKALGRTVPSLAALPEVVAAALQEGKQREERLSAQLAHAEGESNGNHELYEEEAERSAALRKELGTEVGKVRELESAAKALAEEHRIEIEALQGELEGIKGSSEQALRNSQAQASELEKLGERVASLTDQLEEQTQARSSSQEEIESLSAQLVQTKRELAEKTAEREEQGRNVDALNQTARELTQQLDKAKETERALRSQLKERDEENARNAGTIASKDSTIQKQKRELTKARQELDEALIRQSQMDVAHSEELAPLRGKVEELTRELEQTRQSARIERSDLEESRQALEQTKAAQVQNKEQLAESKEEKARLVALLKEISEIEKRNREHLPPFDNLEQELLATALEGSFTSLPKNISSIIATLKGKIRELKEDEKALEGLQSHIVDLEDQLERAQNEKQAHVGALREELAAAREENKSIRGRHRAKRSEQSKVLNQLRSTLRQEREENSERLQIKNEEIQELSQEKGALERTVSLQSTRIRELEEALESKEAEYQDLDRDHQSLQEKFSALQKAQKRLNKQISELEIDRDYYQEHAQGWESQYNIKRDEAQRLGRELYDIKKALAGIEKQREAFHAENEALKRVLSETVGADVYNPEQAASALEHLQKKHLRSLEQKDEDLDRLAATAKRTQEAKAKMRGQRDQARGALAETTATLEQTQREKGRLETHLASAREASDRLINDLGIAHEQIESQARIIGSNAELMQRLRSEKSEMEELLEQVRQDAQDEAGRKAPEVAETYSLFQSVYGEGSEGISLSALSAEEREVFENLWNYLNAENPAWNERATEEVQKISRLIVATPTKLTDFSHFAPFLSAILEINKIATSRTFRDFQREREPQRKKELRLKITKEILQGIIKTIGPRSKLSRFRIEGFGFHLRVFKEVFTSLNPLDYQGQTRQKASQYRNIALLLTGTFRIMFNTVQ